MRAALDEPVRASASACAYPICGVLIDSGLDSGASTNTRKRVIDIAMPAAR